MAKRRFYKYKVGDTVEFKIHKGTKVDVIKGKTFVDGLARYRIGLGAWKTENDIIKKAK